MKSTETPISLGTRAMRKMRSTARAVYASVSKESARSLVHSLEEQKDQISLLKTELKTSSENSRRLAAQNRALTTNLKTSDDIVAVDKRFPSRDEGQSERTRLEAKIKELELHIRKLSGPGSDSDYKKIVHHNQVLKNKLEDMKTKLHRQIESSKNYGVVARYITQENVLTANVFKLLSEHTFDVVIGHDILGIGASTAMASHTDVPLFLDVVEEYNLLNRSGDFFRRNLSDPDALLLNSGINALVEAADQWIQIGPAQIEKFKDQTGFDSLYLPNFRNPLIEQTEHERKALKLLANAGVGRKPFICVPNRITNFDEIQPVVAAVLQNKLPHHIVHVGAPLTEAIRAKIQSELGAEGRGRFHELGLHDYETYRHILTKATCSSFLTKESVFNVKYAFPNRLFDAVSCQTPILTGGFLQVGDFVKENEFGVTIDGDVTEQTVSEALDKLIKKEAGIRKNLKKLSSVYSWDTAFAEAFKDIPAGSNVLIVSRKDLRPNQRIKNLKRSFNEANCNVTVIGGHRVDFEVAEDFYTVPLTRILSDEETLFH